jgi:hypothetical protein
MAPVRRSLRVLACVTMAAGLVLSVAPAAQASTTWYVSPSGQDSSCDQGTPFLTIQFAIDCSSALDTVVVAPGTYAQNLTMHGLLKLVGAGAGSTIIEPTAGATGPVITIQGAYDYRVPEVISGVTITGGHSDAFGGGISIGTFPDQTAELVLIDSLVTGNSADWDGGGIFNEVGSNLRLVHSRVVRNTAADGGGIYNDGGGCFHRSSVVVSNVPDDIVGC